MDMTFVLCPNILGILGLSILLIFMRFSFYLKKRKLNLFRAAAIINLIIIIFEVADYFLGTASFEGAYVLRRITSATGFALTPFLPLLIACIASSKKFSYWIFVPAALNVIFSYSSIFTGSMFYIDSYNSYYRGPLFAVLMAISVFYLALLIYISYLNLKKLNASESIFLICIIVVILLGNLLEILLSFHFLIWNSCALLLISYYLFLHIQYFKFDPLTGVFNRNMFLSAIENLSNKVNIAVVSFDLDDLKKINDLKGHECGDEYIVSSVKVMNEAFSDIGRLYRVGGDEFIVLISNVSENIVIEKIKSFDDKCSGVGVSVSCGYEFSKTAENIDQMIRNADKAMYENKRNRKINR